MQCDIGDWLWGAALLCAGFGAGASSCGSSGKSAGDEFCQQWATDFCNEPYACTPTDMRGSDFLGGIAGAMRLGVEPELLTPPPNGTTALVNCSGGVHVNTAAEPPATTSFRPSLATNSTRPPTSASATRSAPRPAAPARVGRPARVDDRRGWHDQFGRPSGSGGTTGSGGTGGGRVGQAAELGLRNRRALWRQPDRHLDADVGVPEHRGAHAGGPTGHLRPGHRELGERQRLGHCDLQRQSLLPSRRPSRRSSRTSSPCPARTV